MGEISNFYDTASNIDYINLNHYLIQSYNSYVEYTYTNNLTNLKRSERDGVAIHFMLVQILIACKSSRHRKIFHYDDRYSSDKEISLIKRIFNALPIQLVLQSASFKDFLCSIEYFAIRDYDVSRISFAKFRKLLKRYGLQKLEEEFMSNLNIKFTLCV